MVSFDILKDERRFLWIRRLQVRILPAQPVFTPGEPPERAALVVFGIGGAQKAHKRICSGTRCTMCPMASHAGVIRVPKDNATSRGHTDGKRGLYARHGTTAVVEWEALVSVYPCNQSGMTKTARPTRPTVPCARPRWGARHFFAYLLGAPASSRHTSEGVCIAGGRHDGRDRLPARSRRSQ